MSGDIWETGTEPEFVAWRIAKTESAGCGFIRIYWATERGKSLRVEYTQIVPAALLQHLAQSLLFNPPAEPEPPLFVSRPN